MAYVKSRIAKTGAKRVYSIGILFLCIILIGVTIASFKVYNVKAICKEEAKVASAEIGDTKCLEAITDEKNTTLQWQKNEKAEEYEVFAANVGEKEYEKIATTKSNKVEIPSAQKKLVKFKVKSVKGMYDGESGDPILVKTASNENAKCIKITKCSDKAYVGRSMMCEAEVDDNAISQKVTWDVSDESVAKVSKLGLLTPVREGKVTLYAKAHNGLYESREITIEPNETEVPSFFNYAEDDAKDVARNVRLVPVIKHQKITKKEMDKKYPHNHYGQIVAQSIEKGKMVESGAEIELTMIEEKIVKGKKNKDGNSTGKISLGGDFYWPLQYRYPITSSFGYRSAGSTSGVGSTNHHGIDIGAPSGSLILASKPGTVTLSQWYYGYGNCVIIEHSGGYKTLYGHMSKRIAKVGDKVTAGTVIGHVGSTGNSTGPHLHFEVQLNGVPHDPIPYLYGEGKEIKKAEAKNTLKGNETVDDSGSNTGHSNNKSKKDKDKKKKKKDKDKDSRPRNKNKDKDKDKVKKPVDKKPADKKPADTKPQNDKKPVEDKVDSHDDVNNTENFPETEKKEQTKSLTEEN